MSGSRGWRAVKFPKSIANVIVRSEQAVKLEQRANGDSFAGLDTEALDIKIFKFGKNRMELERDIEFLRFFAKPHAGDIQQLLVITNAGDPQMRGASLALAQGLEKGYPLDRIDGVEVDDVHNLLAFYGFHDSLIADKIGDFDERAEIKEMATSSEGVGEASGGEIESTVKTRPRSENTAS